MVSWWILCDSLGLPRFNARDKAIYFSNGVSRSQFSFVQNFKKRSEYKTGRIYVFMEIPRHLRASIMGRGEYLLQRKGSDSSHELNLACCQLEGRHLHCLSVRVIVKAVFAKNATSFLQNTLLKPQREFYPCLLK